MYTDAEHISPVEWTVVSPGEPISLCRCSCGAVETVETSQLRSGASLRCSSCEDALCILCDIECLLAINEEI